MYEIVTLAVATGRPPCGSIYFYYFVFFIIIIIFPPSSFSRLGRRLTRKPVGRCTRGTCPRRAHVINDSRRRAAAIPQVGTRTQWARSVRGPPDACLARAISFISPSRLVRFVTMFLFFHSIYSGCIRSYLTTEEPRAFEGKTRWWFFIPMTYEDVRANVHLRFV